MTDHNGFSADRFSMSIISHLSYINKFPCILCSMQRCIVFPSLLRLDIFVFSTSNDILLHFLTFYKSFNKRFSKKVLRMVIKLAEGMESRWYVPPGQSLSTTKIADRQLALHVTADAWKNVTKHLDRKRLIQEEIDRNVAYRKAMKEGSESMTKNWSNSVEVNFPKRIFSTKFTCWFSAHASAERRSA